MALSNYHCLPVSRVDRLRTVDTLTAPVFHLPGIAWPRHLYSYFLGRLRVLTETDQGRCGACLKTILYLAIVVSGKMN